MVRTGAVLSLMAGLAFSSRTTDSAESVRFVPDALDYLQKLGVPLPTSGNRGGTLRVRFSGLSAPSAGAAVVRTTTAVAQGRAGLSYPALPPASLEGSAYLCGLRQTPADRSNVALVNTGSETDGTVVLRLTVISGDPASPASAVLPDITLQPGEFEQISGILGSNGLAITNGYVKVERVAGAAPYYTYAVINDQANSDGSFVPPVLAEALAGKAGLSLPAAVEAGAFTTELIVTNLAASSKTALLTYVADAIQAAGGAAR